jgi:hypothetical protein
VRWGWLALAVLAAALLAALSGLGTDYGNLHCHLSAPRCDEPGYPLSALAHAHFATYVHQQPLMGPVSLVLRTPFAVVADWTEATLTWHYRITTFACLIVSALLALALVRESRSRDHRWWHTAAVGVLAFVNPLVVSAIDAGHPEELVAAAAVVGSALLALHGRTTASGVVLGLAAATKPWAVLAALPILLVVAAPDRRRFSVVAVLALVACYAPLIAGDPDRFRSVVQTAGTLGSRFGETTASNPWFFFARTGHFTFPSEVRDGQLVFSDAVGYGVSASVARLAHALVLAAALALPFVWWRAGGPSRPQTLFLVIGAILIVRCALDPGNHLYYHAAPALALLGYEATRPHARFPWVAGGFIATIWIVSRARDHLSTDTAFAIVYLAWAALTLIALVRATALTKAASAKT